MRPAGRPLWTLAAAAVALLVVAGPLGAAGWLPGADDGGAAATARPGATDAEPADPLDVITTTIATPEDGRSDGGPVATGTDDGADDASGPGAGVPADAPATDASIPSLVWAPLKTGFRAIVAWRTDAPALGEVTYEVSGSPTAQPVTVTERTPGLSHVFVFHGLPQGETFTFTASHQTLAGTVTSDEHSFVLDNAHMDFTPDVGPNGGVYEINLLVIANERTDPLIREAIETGLDKYAAKLWDATDGWVRAGEVVLLYADLEHMEGGLLTCGIVAVGGHVPPCTNNVDVVFSYDNLPIAAAATFKGAIESDRREIYMNQLWEVNSDEIGLVLLHELGHYAFWMDDLYVAGNCVDHTWDISVMSSSRAVTEFDDEVARCPNEDQLSNYRPSWTIMRDHYPQIPDRPDGPDPGPTGADGGAYRLHIFEGL